MADYAVVVGIARYPGLTADGVVEDLAGPDHDAQDVYDWLVDPQGGRLDPANVRLYRSADIATDQPAPALVALQNGFDWLEQQTRNRQGGRLYLYFSGHGFASALEEAAVFTAEATMRRPNHVPAHSWLRWYRRAQRFRESVLWVDCCMNDLRSIPPAGVGVPDEVGTGVPGPAFIGLAAQTKSAVETTMADGRVRGVFTYTLLQGLRGAAADERGRITGESLRTFLFNVMPVYMPKSAHESAAVDLQPFIRADRGIEFGRRPLPPTFPVHLSAPPNYARARLRIWGDRPTLLLVDQELTGTQWTGELERGLYIAELPGLRHGFQVTGAGEVHETISRPGRAVPERPAANRFRLRVHTDNSAATVIVTDYAFEQIFKDVGTLEMRDKPGVYKVRVEIGRDITMLNEEILLLDQDTELHLQTRPQLASPAPVQGSLQTHEYQMNAFYGARTRTRAGLTAGGSAISVLARYWTPSSLPVAAGLPHPLSGLQLYDAAGELVADLEAACQNEDLKSPDAIAVWERELPPGTYFVQQVLPGGRRLEGAVTASAGWATQVAIQRLGAGTESARTISDVAVFMTGLGGAPNPVDQDAVIEAARLALAQGRNLFEDGHGAALRDLLMSTYRDPIAAIIGCHLLLRAMAQSGADAAQQRWYDDAVRRLRTLVGTSHPDVEALSLRCADAELRTDRPFTAPPLFADSWKLAVEGSYDRRELVPPELGNRVRATSQLGPYLMWAVDANTRAAHKELLVQALNEQPPGMPPRAMSPPREVTLKPAAFPEAAASLAGTVDAGATGDDRAVADARAIGLRLQVPQAVADELRNA